MKFLTPPKECNLLHQKTRAKKSKESVTVYSNNQVRNLIVPDRNPTDLAGIWSNSEFNRLQKQSKVITIQDKKAMIDEIERKNREESEASQMRKESLSKAQKHYYPTSVGKLANVENDARNKSEYLLQRSHELINEQDDRVKAANCVILATKCRAIRNCQIKEKQLIKQETQKESRRLEEMMEQARQKAVLVNEKKNLLEYEKNKRYGNEIKQQIKDNEIEKLLQAERTEEESKMLNRALIAMRKEELEKMEARRLQQQKLRDELNQANLDLERYKLVQKEEQRIADLRIQEFMRQKAAREEAREAELALIKAAKEKEISRLRAQQQKAQDKQALMDEMQAIRIQEDVERTWREKERQTAIKRAEELKALNEARSQQILDIRKTKAIAIARDKAAFYKVAKVQQELFEKDQQKWAQRKEMNLKHRCEILKQINEKERERINELSEKFEDGKAFRLRQELHDNQISQYICKKVQGLKQETLPDHYVNDIERQLKITDLKK